MFMTKDGRKLKARYQDVVVMMYKSGVSDIHDENVIFDKVNDRLVVIDLGDGV